MLFWGDHLVQAIAFCPFILDKIDNNHNNNNKKYPVSFSTDNHFASCETYNDLINCRVVSYTIVYLECCVIFLI